MIVVGDIVKRKKGRATRLFTKSLTGKVVKVYAYYQLLLADVELSDGDMSYHNNIDNLIKCIPRKDVLKSIRRNGYEL